MKVQEVMAGPGRNVIFMTLGFNDYSQATKEVFQAFCDAYPALVRSMNVRFPNDNFSMIVGIGSKAWDGLFPGAPKPKELTEFQAIDGEIQPAVSTPGDLFFHIRANSTDVCYEMAGILANYLQAITFPIDETHGFGYLDGRSIIEFVDGTENPDTDEKVDFALIAEEDPEFVGGSYAFAQKYVHDFDYWQALPVEEQERRIGRRKFNDIELAEEDKSPSAHNIVSKALDDEGEEMRIIRANVAFATPSEKIYGTYFIGYSRYFSTTRLMLEQMFIGNPAGNYDALLDFSTAITGTLFFIPSYPTLAKIADGDY